MRSLSLTTQLAGVFLASLLGMFALSLVLEDQRRYASCLTEHRSPAYCRLLINGR